MASRRKILIVEDESAIQDLYSDILSDYDLTQVLNGGDALKLLGQLFDLYIVDVGLPDTDGFSVIREIREKFPKSKILVETGFPLKGLEKKIHETRPDVVVSKPFRIKEVISHVQSLIHHSP